MGWRRIAAIGFETVATLILTGMAAFVGYALLLWSIV